MGKGRLHMDISVRFPGDSSVKTNLESTAVGKTKGKGIVINWSNTSQNVTCLWITKRPKCRFCSSRFGWGLRFCIFNQPSGAAHASGSWITVRRTQNWRETNRPVLSPHPQPPPVLINTQTASSIRPLVRALRLVFQTKWTGGQEEASRKVKKT